MEATLDYCGLGEPHTIYHDDDDVRAEGVDKWLLKTINDLRPDLLVVSPLMEGYEHNVKMETLAELKSYRDIFR